MSNDEKQKEHWRKAKKAVLVRIDELAGTASIGDLHGYAEANWFIAHQRFSSLMEECVDEDLVTFEEGQFALTDQGRALANQA